LGQKSKNTLLGEERKESDLPSLQKGSQQQQPLFGPFLKPAPKILAVGADFGAGNEITDNAGNLVS